MTRHYLPYPEVDMSRRLTIVFGILVLLMTVSVSFSQGRGRGQGGGAAAAPPASAAPGGFGRDEARIIVDWFHDSNNLSGLPPGLAKREQLPPGLQRQLVRNGKLPPGLEKKIQPLPPVLVAKLPPLPEDRTRVIIGGNIILMEKSTSIIVDILIDIF
jgi:hypothetical protein